MQFSKKMFKFSKGFFSQSSFECKYIFYQGFKQYEYLRKSIFLGGILGTLSLFYEIKKEYLSRNQKIFQFFFILFCTACSFYLQLQSKKYVHMLKISKDKKRFFSQTFFDRIHHEDDGNYFNFEDIEEVRVDYVFDKINLKLKNDQLIIQINQNEMEDNDTTEYIINALEGKETANKEILKKKINKFR